MSLDYVHKGEAVKASTINSIIDTLGGNQRMSPDLDVTTTARGPQVSMPSKYGSPNSKPDQLLEVGRYVLSAWPMAKLLLGPELEDCLNSMRYHAADGTVKNAVSAAMIYENSSDCPVGNQISGRLLNEDDFGQDKAAGAAGWVQTYMEDPFSGKSPVRAELWAWEDKEKLAAVFTNVDDKDDVKEQLSGILQSGGADQLSTLTRIDSWILQDGKALSDGQRNVPAHAVVKKTGTIDYFEQADAAEYKAVLKADLYCFAKEQDGSTKWTWRMPLGAGATCSSGKVHCPSLTYGGNPVVIEVTQNEVGPNYDGEANYYDGYLTYGLFTAQEGENCDADEIWLNLSYDYNEKAVVGEFSDQESSTSYSSDGILHRNVLVAKASAFTPAEDTEVGDTSPREAVEHGTWGVLPKDGPKLDSYCKEDSTTEFKSLDWANRNGCIVDCQCTELYRFDKLEVADPLSTDHIVVRRPDDYGGAQVKYVPLSSLEISGLYVPPDADVPEAEMSSIQTYELSDEGKTVIELFDFHNKENNVSTELSTAAMNYEFIVRANDHVEYVTLSGNALSDIVPDATVEDGQKSIDWQEDAEARVVQLYKFNEAGLTSTFKPDAMVNLTREKLLPDEYEFVLRKDGAGGEVTYGNIELSVYAIPLSGDSQIGSSNSISVVENTIQLYHMDRNGTETSAEVPNNADDPENVLGTDCEFVIRTGGAGGSIDYKTLKLRQAKLPVDTNEYPNQKSLEYLTANNKTFLQLNGFNSAGTALPVAELSSKTKSLLPADNEFVIRKKVGNSWQIAYAPLSAKVSAEVNTDFDIEQTQRSLEWAEDDGEEYLQLYNMDMAGEALPQKAINMSADGYTPLLPSSYEFVLRKDGAGGQITYANLSCCIPDLSGLSGTVVSGDTQVIQTSKSIELKEDQNGKKYNQLYNFDGCTGCWGDFTVRFCDNGCVTPIGCEAAFVVRQPQGQGHYVEYVPLSLTQEHEHLDSQSLGLGSSLSWHSEDEGYGCIEYIELYNFIEASSEDIEPEDIDAPTADAILIRKNDGVRNELRYMSFSSLSTFTPTYKGDSQLPNSRIRSISSYVIQDNEYALELYDWQNSGNTQTVTIYTDGCTYRWPQNTKVDSSSNAADYILVKHQDSSGTTLQYKQLHVVMPNMSSYDSDITNIYNEMNDYSTNVTIISGAIDSLSGALDGLSSDVSGLTADYWESGGDSGTCYGSSIGDSSGNGAVYLDGHILDGSWETGGSHYVDGCLTVDGSASVGETLLVGSSNSMSDNSVSFGPIVNCNGINSSGCITAPFVCCGNSTYDDGSLTLGSTTLTEAQLQRLLALI